MIKATGRYVPRLVFAFVTFLVPAFSQGTRRDAPPPSPPRDARPAHAQDEGAAEQGLWDSIKGGSDPQGFKAYLAKYPEGRFGGAARSRLAALLGEDYVALFTKLVVVNRRWSEVEGVLVRRADLIPRLFDASRAAGVQEPEVWGRIAGARARLLAAANAPPQGEGGAKAPGQKRAVIEADHDFGAALGGLDSLLENYPQLRSNEIFMKARDELEGAGNRRNVRRADYNEAVRDYHAARSRPRAAGADERHGWAEEPYFESEQGRPAEPKVNAAPPRRASTSP
jgi:LemA protein